MTELFADITLGTVIVAGLVMIGGVIFVANMNDPRNAMHPGGRMGRLRDELLVAGTVAPFLVMIVVGWNFPTLREQVWWLPALLVLCVVCVLARFLIPGVRRAQARVVSLKKEAFS